MKTVIALAAVLAAVGSSPASARTVATTEVYYGDLDLGSAAGMSEVKARIAVAAHLMCGDDVSTRRRAGLCYRIAVQHAMLRLPGDTIELALW